MHATRDVTLDDIVVALLVSNRLATGAAGAVSTGAGSNVNGAAFAAGGHSESGTRGKRDENTTGSLVLHTHAPDRIYGYAPYGRRQSTGAAPNVPSNSLVRENGRDPKNPREADNGEGWADSR